MGCYYSYTISASETVWLWMHWPQSITFDIQKSPWEWHTIWVHHWSSLTMLEETWVIVMIIIITRLYKCIDICFVVNNKNHMIFDGFWLTSNGNSDVVEVVSSLSSKGSYITITQSYHRHLLWKLGWAQYWMFSLLYLLFVLMIDLPFKFKLMSLNSFWIQCITISCNLLMTVLPCHCFLYSTVKVIPFNIVAKWCPINYHLMLSLFLIGVIDLSSSIMFTMFGDNHV